MSDSPPKPNRKHFSSGDYLTRYPPGSPFALRIDSSYEKPGWKARIPSAYRTRPPYPGTAILFEGIHYEVAMFRWKGGTFPRYFYYLNPWDEAFPVREPMKYDAAECKRVVEQLKSEARTTRKGSGLAILSPLCGLLPASDQKRIENQYGVIGSRMSLYSALVMLPPASWALIARWVSGFGGAMPGPSIPEPILLVGSYLWVESLLRMVYCVHFGEPIGSAPVVLPIELVRGIRRELSPAYRQRLFEQMNVGPRGRQRLENARDEVIEAYGKEHDLEVVSILPKPHWSPQIGVLYGETWYFPIDSRTLRDGTQLRYQFFLKRAPEHSVFRSTVTYVAEEVRDLWKARRRRDLGTWVDTFSPFWGLADEADQKRLEEIYGFEAVRFSRITTWTILAGAGFAVAASIANLVGGLAVPADLAWLAGGGYLLLESWSRLRALREGRPTGSLLGLPLKPIVKRFLE